MRKIIILTTLVFTLLFSLGFETSAYSLVDLESTDGGVVTYRGSDEVVQIPDVYELNGTEFRGAWVSRFAGDIGSYVDKETWISDVAGLIEVFKAYNLNTMIFHIRTHNNALYDSDLNPIASWWTEVNFDEFDPLEYLIDECHKAGIEFHAWMNPYRITTKTNSIEEAMAEGQYLGEKVPSSNPARFAGNLIAGKAGVILNPGLPKVRDFIVDTCMEVVRKYDVDAIHFDDYFYISGSVDDDTFAKYNPKKLSLADWRREQVNLFIEQLHDEMTAYNEEFDKAVQIGISPSGIYRNGNGSVESGSNTAGFAHYGDYLYSDTYKWAKEGWIDYLLPQSYWGFEHPSAGYADVMDWWNKAFEGLDCLLYSGIGIYMANEAGNTYSWKYNYHELANQLKYLTKLENVSGYSIYKYSYMKMAYEDQNKATTFQVNNAYKAGCFKDVALYPEIKTMTPIVLEAVKDLKFSENTLSFSKYADAKAYAIYKSDKELTFDNSEIVALIGGEDMTITWVDENPGVYNYGVRAISGTNTLGAVAVAEVDKPVTPTYTVTFTDGDGHVLLTVEVKEGASAKAPEDPKKEGYTFVGWDQEFDNVTADLVVNPIFEKVGVDNPTPPVEPSDPTPPTPNEKGCKKELSMVIIGLISIVTLGIITLKKEK